MHSQCIARDCFPAWQIGPILKSSRAEQSQTLLAPTPSALDDPALANHLTITSLANCRLSDYRKLSSCPTLAATVARYRHTANMSSVPKLLTFCRQIALVPIGDWHSALVPFALDAIPVRELAERTSSTSCQLSIPKAGVWAAK